MAAAALLSGCGSVRPAHAQQPVAELIPTDSLITPAQLDIVPAVPIPEPSLEMKVGQMIMVGFGQHYPDFGSAIVPGYCRWGSRQRRALWAQH
ncbi:MAG: hypothetical protein R2867_24760 [Caldilineaceae bacterium]